MTRHNYKSLLTGMAWKFSLVRLVVRWDMDGIGETSEQTAAREKVYIDAVRDFAMLPSSLRLTR